MIYYNVVFTLFSTLDIVLKQEKVIHTPACQHAFLRTLNSLAERARMRLHQVVVVGTCMSSSKIVCTRWPVKHIQALGLHLTLPRVALPQQTTCYFETCIL